MKTKKKKEKQDFVLILMNKHNIQHAKEQKEKNFRENKK